MLKFFVLRTVLLMLFTYITVIQGLVVLYHKVECIDNESFKEFGKVDRCEIKLGKRFTSVLNMKVYLKQELSPDFVGIYIHISFYYYSTISGDSLFL